MEPITFLVVALAVILIAAAMFDKLDWFKAVVGVVLLVALWYVVTGSVRT